MADIRRKQYEEEVELKLQRDFEIFKRRLDTMFHPTLEREKIPEAFLKKYYDLDIKWSHEVEDMEKAIHRIEIHPNVNWVDETGMVFWLDKRMMIPMELIKTSYLGICHTMYKVIGGNPNQALQYKDHNKMLPMISKSIQGNGPHVECKGEEDTELWSPGMTEDSMQHITLAYNKENQKYKIFARTLAFTLQQKLQEKVLECKEKKMTLLEFVKKPYLLDYLKMSLRNARRLVVDAARYFHTEIDTEVDEKAFCEDNYHFTKATLGMPKSIGFSNIFVHYPGMKSTRYRIYVTSLRTSPQEISLFNEDDEKEESICFFKGMIPHQRYSMNTKKKDKVLTFGGVNGEKWKGFTSVNDGRSILSFGVECDDEKCRYLAYPAVFRSIGR